MKCTILHEGKGRMRVHVEKVRMTLHRADVLEAYLNLGRQPQAEPRVSG